ncbi:MAG: S-layer homology domain-containing protein, partial [Firmicutes bacterium]|nr:S-layer homology domain-containing protein [Bacillota bacterium]
VGKSYKVLAISADGSMELMTGICVVENGKKVIKVSSSHLTTFVVTTEEVKNPFADVHESDYFYNPVMWALEKNVTGGVSADSFAPFNGCTRAQMVTFLWRAAGKPWASANHHFSDVASDAYYAEAVEWAIVSGITKGIGETTFAPNDTVTREQLASFIYRYAVEKGQGYETAPTTKLDFNDAGSVHAWADEAMHWCVENNIVSGMGEKMLAPQNEANRAQIVTMLYRYFNM